MTANISALKQTISKKWIVALAGLTALIYLFPTLLYHRNHSWDYFPRYSYDEEYYAVLAKSTAAGEALTANPYLAGHEQDQLRSSESITFLPRYAAAALVRELGVGRGYAAILLIVPLALWGLIYSLVRRLGGDALWAAAAGCGVLLLPYLLSPLVLTAKNLAALAIHGSWFGANAELQIHYLKRYNPALSAIAFYGFLSFHWRGAQRASRGGDWIAAVCGGLLFYCYFFFAVVALAFSALWTVYRVAANPKDWLAAGAPLAAQLVISIPFVVWSLQNMRHYRESMSVPVRAPYLPWPHLAALVLAMAVVAFSGRAHLEPPRIWLLLLGLAALLALNQHVVTGLHVEPWHFDAYVVAPFTLLIFCAAMGMRESAASGRAGTVLACGMIALALAHGASLQLFNARRIGAEENAADHARLFRGVREAAQASDVVLADAGSPLPSWLVLHTGRHVYVSQFLAFLPVPDRQELRERALCYYWLRGDDRAGFEAEGVNNTFSVLYNPEGSRYWFFPQLLTPEVREARIREYEACGRDPESCCRRDRKINWIAETGAVRFNRARIARLFAIERIERGAGYQLLYVERLPLVPQTP